MAQSPKPTKPTPAKPLPTWTPVAKVGGSRTVAAPDDAKKESADG